MKTRVKHQKTRKVKGVKKRAFKEPRMSKKGAAMVDRWMRGDTSDVDLSNLRRAGERYKADIESGRLVVIR